LQGRNGGGIKRGSNGQRRSRPCREGLGEFGKEKNGVFKGIRGKIKMGGSDMADTAAVPIR